MAPVHDKPRNQERRYGGVIIFREDITDHERERVIEALKRYCRTVDVREFNPDWGEPVFYIP